MKLVIFALMGMPWLNAAPIEFGTVPSTGSVSGAASTSVGWGYSVTNQTSFYLLPIGISSSGALFGAIEDIFDYPVVDPGQMVTQSYAFNPPGGFGNSLGLFEYAIPAGTPTGIIQSGTFSLLYVLYDADPDLNPLASAIGPPQTLTTPFEVVVASDVPEPSTLNLLMTCALVIALRNSGSAVRLFLQQNR